VLLSFCLLSFVRAQDTFSIIALDSSRRSVGSAGASCVDLVALKIEDASFLADHVPGVGGIHTQAAYLVANQNKALKALEAGEGAAEIIDILIGEDAEGNASIRQYGVVIFGQNRPQVAAFTGDSCLVEKHHITGDINGMYYSVQGNILSSPKILQSMESAFRMTEGDLACRLMAAMQAANMVGADARCSVEKTSSLFSFLKLTEATDAAGQPSLSVEVSLPSGSGAEPIDSLQILFNKKHPCGAYSD